MLQETFLGSSREFLNSQLKRGFFLSRGGLRLKVEPDSSITYLDSRGTRRLLFGRGSAELFKVQAGIIVPLRQRELKVRFPSPTSVEFSSRPQDQIQVTQTTTLVFGPPTGYTRRVRVTNPLPSPVHVRLLTLADPSSLNFRRREDPPGEIGMNAFNRGDHVVMDDVGDTTGSRAVGFNPRPNSIYMTRDKQRVLDLLGTGELPESISGMSGAIMILAQQDADVPPGGAAEFTTAGLYDASSLGTALEGLTGALARPQDSGAAYLEAESVFRCSNPTINFAYDWAKAALHSIEGEGDNLERLSAGPGLSLVRSEYFQREFENLKKAQRKDGLVPRTGTSEGGVLETSLFLTNACLFLAFREDKKLRRSWYSTLRKAGSSLLAAGKDGTVHASTAHPEGWRRRLESGFPTGVTSELNLAVARALNELATLASSLAKGKDSATFKEASMKLVASLNGLLRDPKTGSLALNMDARGTVHPEFTIDHGMALYHLPYDHNLASFAVHRLLEKDFESGLGPRCVPTSNLLYYNPTYGDGQLGSCWTRATLSHSVLAYEAGFPTIGGLQLEKVARLVASGWEKVGGVPGEFPYWFSESDGLVLGGPGSDPVAAGRLIEAVVWGELGLDRAPQGFELRPPDSSTLHWASMHGMNLGEKGSIFVGRSEGKVVLSASSFSRADADESTKFQSCTRLGSGQAETLVFTGPSSMLVCTASTQGGTGTAPLSSVLTIPMKGALMAASLFVDIDEFNPITGLWARVDRRRLSGDLSLQVELRPGAWKAIRIAPATREPPVRTK
ncbi:MAG: hypothetical protein OK456_07110 [Thaumarchaeota archaeon]|nr:hypothetical protein [Nitrososphaerota archaeon]